MVMSDLPRGRALARAYHVSDDQNYAVNQRVGVLRAHSIDSRFLALYANRNPQFLAHDDGSNQTHLPNAAFKSLTVPVPPPAEQRAIVEDLSTERGAINRALGRRRRANELVSEYRARLIGDAVSGKFDVRGAAVELPDESVARPWLESDDGLPEFDETSDEATERAEG